MDYECVIGLEVHVQLLTDTKIFCSCPNKFSHDPNTHVCPVCLGLPGSLPVLNRQAVEQGLKAALALDFTIPPLMKFDRKHYYYPDLPKNIQISQYDQPLAVRGGLDIVLDGQKRRVNITRAHLEEDAGKLIHSGAVSNVDLNRTGTPLLEIVSEPDIRSPKEARLYMEMLRNILVYTGVTDGSMEEGSLRCDANISVRPFGESKLGVKNEIKNMNSFRGVENALQLVYQELCRQMDDHEEIKQVTWGYSIESQKIFQMRVKEDANDYRYFPEPDLPPVAISRELVERVRAELPELPLAKGERLRAEYGLGDYEADLLIADRALADYFEEAAKRSGAPKEAANWVINDVTRAVNDKGVPLKDFPLTPVALADVIAAVQAKKINMPTARKIFAQIVAGDQREVAAIIEQDNLTQVTDVAAISEALKAAIAKNPQAEAEVRGGKAQTAMWFVGQIMQQLRGKAAPDAVTAAVAEFFGLDPAMFAKNKKKK